MKLLVVLVVVVECDEIAKAFPLPSTLLHWVLHRTAPLSSVGINGEPEIRLRAPLYSGPCSLITSWFNPSLSSESGSVGGRSLEWLSFWASCEPGTKCQKSNLLFTKLFSSPLFFSRRAQVKCEITCSTCTTRPSGESIWSIWGI